MSIKLLLFLVISIYSAVSPLPNIVSNPCLSFPCHTGTLITQKKSKTIEWLITWRKHLKQCPLCSKRAHDTDCSICLESPTNPITLPCNHIFCRSCISDWFGQRKNCPICRAVPPDNFIAGQLGLDPFAQRPADTSGDGPMPRIYYYTNISCLLTTLTLDGAIIGCSTGIISRLLRRHNPHTNTIFALHYLSMLSSWLCARRIAQKCWHPAFQVSNPQAQFDLARAISRKTTIGVVSSLIGICAGLAASKPLYQQYERLAKILDD